MKNPGTLAVLILVLGLSGFVRLQGLRWGVPIQSRFTTLYVDEYTPIHVLSQMNPRRLQLNPHYFTDPTFFYYQLGVVYQVASWIHLLKISSDQSYYLTHVEEYAAMYWIGRLLVVVYGVGLTLIIFFLGRRIGGSDARGLWPALFYALTPLAVLSCHIIDVGVPVSFWLGTAFLCLVIALQMRKERWLILGALCAGFSFSTKYTSAPIVLPLLYAVWRSGGRGRVLSIALGVFAAGFLIGMPYSLLDLKGFWAQFYGVAFHIAVGHKAPPASIGYLLSFLWLYPISVGTVLTLLCVAGLLQKLGSRSDPAIMAILFLVPYATLLATSSFHVNRYLNETLGFLLPFAGVPILTLWHLPMKAAKVAAIGLGLLAFSRVPYTFAINRSLANEIDPRDQASEWIRTHIPAGSVIGTELEPNFMTPGHLYMHYWKAQRYPTAELIPPDYTIIVWDAQREAWPDRSITYWVQSNMFFSGMGMKDPVLISRVRDQRLRMEQGFYPAISFERHLHWGPFHYTMPSHAGHDWFAFFPTITLLEKKSSI